MHKDPKEPFATGSFIVAQFDSSQKPFVAFGKVRTAVKALIEIATRMRVVKH